MIASDLEKNPGLSRVHTLKLSLSIFCNVLFSWCLVFFISFGSFPLCVSQLHLMHFLLSSRWDPDQSSSGKTLAYMVRTVITRYLRRICSRNPLDTKIHASAVDLYVKWSSAGGSSHQLALNPKFQPQFVGCVNPCVFLQMCEPWIWRANCMCFQS